MSYALNAIKRARRNARALLVAAAALGLAATGGAARPADEPAQDLKKFNQFVQTSNTPAMRALREGRDLIDAEQWAKAAEKFTQFVNAYPKDKDVDVALYWLAYSRKKQGDPRGAVQPLQQLFKKHAQSAWADEARALLTEIAGELGDSKIAQNTLDDSKEQDEMKIVALQSLFQANPERALTYASEMLKPGSTASPRLKEAAVSLIGSRGGPGAQAMLLDIARNAPDPNLRARAIRGLGDEGGDRMLDTLVQLYDAEQSVEVRRQILRALFEMSENPRAHAKLLQVARNASENTDLRRTAIHRLGERKNPAAFDDLTQIYNAEQNVEVKRQIIHALAEMDDPRAQARVLEVARNASENREIRRQAIHQLGERGEGSLDELMRIYESDRDTEVRKQILHAFSDMKSPRARQKLIEAARAGDNVELRRAAIHWVAEADDPQTLDMLISMYDAEPQQEVKRQLLHAFSESKQKRALQKLMDVARRDSSVELRKQAIHWIGESNDPDALKFLEDVLKP
jgi:HEAT repeat protein